jgi:hypothetical protein
MRGSILPSKTGRATGSKLGGGGGPGGSRAETEEIRYDIQNN